MQRGLGNRHRRCSVALLPVTLSVATVAKLGPSMQLLAHIVILRTRLLCLRAASYVQYSLAHQHTIRSHILTSIRMSIQICLICLICINTVFTVGARLILPCSVPTYARWLYPGSMDAIPRQHVHATRAQRTHAVVKCRYGLHEVSLFTFYFIVNFLYLGRPSSRVEAIAAPLLARLRPETDAAAVGLHLRIGDSQLANAKMQNVTRYPQQCGPPQATCG